MATATVSLGLDATPFAKGLQDAEQKSKTFAGRIKGMFAGDLLRGERRVGKSAGFFATELLQANSAAELATAGVQSLAGAFRIGFGATVAAVAGIQLFKKFQEGVEASKEAYSGLQSETNRPIGLQSGLSPEGIGKEIEATHAAREKAFKEATNDANKQKSGALRIKDVLTGGHEAEDFANALLKPIDEADSHLEELGRARANAEMAVTAAKETSLKTSEREGKLLEIAAKYDEKRAAIRLGKLDPGTGDRLKNLTKEQDLETTGAKEAADQRARELDMHKRIASLAAGVRVTEQASADGGHMRITIANSLLTTAQQHIAALKEQGRLIDDQERSATQLTAEKRAQLALESLTTRNQLHRAEYAEFRKPSAQRSAERIEEQRFQQFVKGTQTQSPRNQTGFESAFPNVWASKHWTDGGAGLAAVAAKKHEQEQRGNGKGDSNSILNEILTYVKKWADD